MIQVADPGAAYRAQKQEIDAAVARVLASGWYILGAEVEAFEREFAAWAGGGHCVSCASGTDALVLALRGLGLGPGDLVATVSHTAVATVAAIELMGAHAELLDVEAPRYTLSPKSLKELLTHASGRLKAVVVVHLYGQMADMPAIEVLCREHELLLIEDCAQAQGARLNGRLAGSWGQAASFSFYPTKNMGALGDGGAVIFKEAAHAEEARLLRQYGWRERYISEEAGFNSRLDELQAAVLRVKLPRLEADNARRRAIAKRYDAQLATMGWDAPFVADGVEHVYHQYVIRHTRRDALAAHLKAQGVGSAVLYPVPIHRQPAYQDRVSLGEDGLAATEALAKEILSLPVHPGLTDADVEQVCGALASFA
jgi:dTDP-4-amino-4,6-dideoxygalactose transaminase